MYTSGKNTVFTTSGKKRYNKSYLKSICPRHGFIKIQISYKVKETINKIRKHQLEGYISNVKMEGCCL